MILQGYVQHKFHTWWIKQIKNQYVIIYLKLVTNNDTKLWKIEWFYQKYISYLFFCSEHIYTIKINHRLFQNIMHQTVPYFTILSKSISYQQSTTPQLLQQFINQIFQGTRQDCMYNLLWKTNHIFFQYNSNSYRNY